MTGVLVDAGFLITLLSRRDRHHSWAAAQLPRRVVGLRWPRCCAAAPWCPPSISPKSKPASWI